MQSKKTSSTEVPKCTFKRRQDKNCNVLKKFFVGSKKALKKSLRIGGPIFENIPFYEIALYYLNRVQQL